MAVGGHAKVRLGICDFGDAAGRAAMQGFLIGDAGGFKFGAPGDRGFLITVTKMIFVPSRGVATDTSPRLSAAKVNA